MKLVLRSDVDNVGKKGDIVDVAAGFGRNYLLRRGLAFTGDRGRDGAGHRDAPVARRERREGARRRVKRWPGCSCPR